MTRDEIKEKLFRFLREQFVPAGPLEEKMCFADAGLDSLDLVEAVMWLEEEFKVTISDEEMERLQTPGETIDLVYAKLRSTSTLPPVTTVSRELPAHLLREEVNNLQALVRHLEGFTDTDERITFYERRFYPFSNFSAFRVEIDVGQGTHDFDTSEHAYHAAKFVGPGVSERAFAHYLVVANAPSAHAAMIHARVNKEAWRPDWQENKRAIMKVICRAKLEQHAYIQQKLVESGDRLLVEASPVDDYWGWGPNRDGANELGKIWMELRDEARAEHPEWWSK